jgi:hypothetical protein
MGAFETMAPCKGTLISLPLNRGPQQLDNFVIIKDERVTAHFGFVGKADRTTVDQRSFWTLTGSEPAVRSARSVPR